MHDDDIKPIMVCGRFMIIELAIFVGMFGCVIYGTSKIVLQAIWLQSFIETPAVIEQADVRIGKTFQRKTGWKDDHRPVVRFSYEVDGRRYSSERFAPLPDVATPQRLFRLLGGLDPGTMVTAYRNPQNPGDAYLFREVSHDPYFVVVLACAIFAAFAANHFSLKRPIELAVWQISLQAIIASVVLHYRYVLPEPDRDMLPLMLAPALVCFAPLLYALFRRSVGEPDSDVSPDSDAG